MRSALAFVLTAFSLVACAGPGAIADFSQVENLAAYYGVWRPTSLDERFIRPSCHRDISIEITETKFIYRSEKLEISASYRAVPHRGKMLFTMTDVRHNGEKSCRQHKPEIAILNFDTRPYLAVVDGNLRKYSRRYPCCFSEYERHDVPGSSTP